MESGIEAVIAALDDLDVAWDKLASLSVESLPVLDLLAVLDRLEVQRRRQPAVEHRVLTQVQAQATPREAGAKSWPAVLAQRLGISRADARRRLAEAAVLGPRRTVTGQPLEPLLPRTAAAQAGGRIGAEHTAVIREFFEELPADVDPDTRVTAEAQLAGLAGGLTPEHLRKVAAELMGYLDQDGTLDDEREHARRRGLVLGRQELDGMSRLSGWVDPALRAGLEALLATLAAPGHCNPDDEDPCIGGVATEAQVQGDGRSAAQRGHDALAAALAAALASTTLGRHNGLPVTVIATTTLAELTAGAGRVRTAGGSRLPVPTLIRAAGTVHPFLLLLGENPKQVQLYHGRRRRTASYGQRLALFALERGCTKPGCTTPANQTQVHHAHRDWQHGGRTDINELTLACGPDNRLVDHTPTGWTTRKRRSDNRTQWIPPPHLDRGQNRINHYHHPEELLRDDEDDEPG